MASRPLMIASLLGASVGVPYFASNAQKAATPAGAQSSVTSGPHYASSAPHPPAAANAVQPFMSNGQPAHYPAYPTTAPKTNGSPITPASQVLRFDLSKQWVDATWPRKTIAPTDVGLTSVRVPLVSGTQPSSLAGSLTYFFNVQGQIEHISFRGRTADASPLIQLLTQTYQLQRVDAGVGEQVYQVRSGDGVQSELRVLTAGVVSSNTPQQNVAIELELARPGSPRTLPPRGPSLNLPPDATAPASNPSTAGASNGSVTDSIKSAASSYWDQIHYATPEEKAPAMMNRWPD